MYPVHSSSWSVAHRGRGVWRWSFLAALAAILANSPLFAATETSVFQPLSLLNNRWTDAGNWSTADYPHNHDDVTYDVIAAAENDYLQLTVEENVEVNRLSLGNTLFLLEGNRFAIREAFHWLAGGLDGIRGKYDVAGDVWFESLAQKRLGGICELTLRANSYWTGGELRFAVYSKLFNQTNAVFRIQTGGVFGDWQTTSYVEFFNLGRLILEATNEVCYFFAPLHNPGELQVHTGTLRLGQSLDGGGRIQVETNATLFVERGAAFDGMAFENQGHIILADTANFLKPTRLPGPVEFQQGFRAAGDVTVDDAVWKAGAIEGSGRLVIAEAGRMDFAAVGSFLSLPIENRGRLTVRNGAYIYSQSAGTYSNLTGAVIELEDATHIGGIGAPTAGIANEGMLLKTGLVGDSVVADSVAGNGTVEVQSGKLQLAGGVVSEGQFTIAPFATLEMGGTNRLGPQARLAGKGALLLGGVSEFAGTLDTNLYVHFAGVPLLMSDIRCHELNRARISGVVAGPGNLVVNQELSFNHPLLEGTGQLVSRGITFMGDPNAAYLVLGNQRRLVTSGSAFFTNAWISLHGESSWSNAADLALRGTTRMERFDTPRFDNSGTIEIDGEDAVATLWFSTHSGLLSLRAGTATLAAADSVSGEIRVDERATLYIRDAIFQRPAILQSSGLLQFVQGTTLFSGGLTNTAPTIVDGAQVQFADTAEVQFGDVYAFQSQTTFRGARARFTGTWYLEEGAATLTNACLAAPRGIVATGAEVAGSGEVSADGVLDSCRLQPGGASGVLRWNGDLRMTGTNSALAFQLAPDRVRSALAVQGRTSIRGSLLLNLAPALVPGFTMTNLVSLIESTEPLDLAFSNVTPGTRFFLIPGVITARVFYGTNSPYGVDRMVLADFATPFDLWRLGRFSAAELADSSVSGPGADPDGNGLPNLVEFALGVGHGAIPPGSLPVILIPTNSITPPSIIVRRPVPLGPLQIRVRASEDLTFWRDHVVGSQSTVFTQSSLVEQGGFQTFTLLYRPILSPVRRWFVQLLIEPIPW